MAKKMKRSATEDESSSSGASSSDDISREEAARRRRSQLRKNATKKERSYSQGEEIINSLAKIKEEVCKQSKQVTEEMHKQLEKLWEEMCKQSKQASEGKEDICKQLEKVKQDNQEMRKQLTEILSDLRKQWDIHTNSSSGDDSDALRSQSNPVQPPRYRLVFKSGMTDIIEKGQIIDISVALIDGSNGQTVEIGPLASATVELVVVNAEFNQHNNQYNWSREDFKSNIKKAQERNSATGDVDQSVKSIVSNGQFNLVDGARCHSGSTIFSNSSNKKVRLGVMVVSPTEERVLEGLSDPFYVRGHDRPARQSKLRHNRSNTQRQTIADNSYQVQNGQMPNLQNSLFPNSTQTGETRFNTTTRLQLPILGDTTMPRAGLNINEEQRLPSIGNTPILSVEPSTSSQEQQASIQYHHFPHLPMMAQPTNNQIEELSPLALVGHIRNPSYIDNNLVSVDEVGMQFFMDQSVALPVQLLWDRSNVESSKRRWNIFDKLHTSPQEHFGSLASKQKSVLHTRQRSRVLIEPLEPDDSDEERPLNSRRQSKYQLRFVNKVCESYYTRDQIKADDGNLLMVALFDENNTKITSGPLSSASVEVVALHGDFNGDGQDYWTSEEFSRSVVNPPPGEEALSVLGGDRTLVLAGGEACLGDTFFQRTSFCARTAKFKMGVRLLANAQEERIQEGISEPFRVKNRRVEDELSGIDGATTHKAPPPGFRFQPTHKELLENLWRSCCDAKSFPVQVIAEVDVYKFDPWDLPAKASFGEDESYFFSEPATVGTLERYRAAGSGYWHWKATDEQEEMAIPFSAGDDDDMMLGFKKTLVFYTGHAPKGSETSWIMDEYRLSGTSSSRLDERVLCKIYNKPRLPVLSSYGRVPQLRQQLPELPPGFRFHPSDEELVSLYLHDKVANRRIAPTIIPEFVDLHEHKPWDLPDVAKLSEGEWYFFCFRDRKYATGAGTNRATQSGYWKATRKDRTITGLSAASGHDKITLGYKKTLIYHTGRAPKGVRTNWLMHEYRLHDNNPLSAAMDSGSSTSITSDQWLLCRVMHKKTDEPDLLTTPPFLDDCNLQQLPGTISANMDSSQQEELQVPSGTTPQAVSARLINIK